MLQRLHLAHSPDSNYFALATGSQTIRIWDAPARKYHSGEASVLEPYVMEFDTGEIGIMHLEFVSKDSFICVHENGMIQLWMLSLPDKEVSPPSVKFEGKGGSFELYGDDRKVEKVSDDLEASLQWTLDVGRLGAAVSWVNQGVAGEAHVALGGNGGEMMWLEVTSQDLKLKTLGRLPSGISLVSISPDGTRVATASRDRRVAIWRPTESLNKDEHTGAWRIFPENGGEIWALEFSHSGRFLAGGGIDNGVYLWDLRAKRALRAVSRDHKGWISDVAWSADDRVIACASWDNTVGLFRGKDLMPLFCFEMHSDYVSQVLFAGESASLISGGYDHRLAIWNWRTAELEHEEKAHDDWIQSLLWLGDDLFASAASDQQICIWSMRTQKKEIVLGDRPSLDWRTSDSFASFETLGATDSGGFTTVRPGSRRDVVAQIAQRAMIAASEPGLDSEVSVFFDEGPMVQALAPTKSAPPEPLDPQDLETQEAPHLMEEEPKEERETQEFLFGTDEGPELSEEFEEEPLVANSQPEEESLDALSEPSVSSLSEPSSSSLPGASAPLLVELSPDHGVSETVAESMPFSEPLNEAVPAFIPEEEGGLPQASDDIESSFEQDDDEQPQTEASSSEPKLEIPQGLSEASGSGGHTEIFATSFSEQEGGEESSHLFPGLSEASAPSIVNFFSDQEADLEQEEALSIQGASLSSERLSSPALDPEEDDDGSGLLNLIAKLPQDPQDVAPRSSVDEESTPSEHMISPQEDVLLSASESSQTLSEPIPDDQTQGPWLRSISWSEEPSAPFVPDHVEAQEPEGSLVSESAPQPEQPSESEQISEVAQDSEPSQEGADSSFQEEERTVLPTFNWAQIVGEQETSSSSVDTSERLQNYKHASQESIDAFFDQMMVEHNIPMESFADFSSEISQEHPPTKEFEDLPSPPSLPLDEESHQTEASVASSLPNESNDQEASEVSEERSSVSDVAADPSASVAEVVSDEALSPASVSESESESEVSPLAQDASSVVQEPEDEEGSEVSDQEAVKKLSNTLETHKPFAQNESSVAWSAPGSEESEAQVPEPETSKPKISRAQMRALLKRKLKKSNADETKEMDVVVEPDPPEQSLAEFISASQNANELSEVSQTMQIDSVSQASLVDAISEPQDIKSIEEEIRETQVFESLSSPSYSESMPALDPDSEMEDSKVSPSESSSALDDDSEEQSEPEAMGDTMTLHSVALAHALAQDEKGILAAVAKPELSSSNDEGTKPSLSQDKSSLSTETSPSSLQPKTMEEEAKEFDRVEATKRATSLADFLRTDHRAKETPLPGQPQSTMHAFMEKPKSVKVSALGKRESNASDPEILLDASMEANPATSLAEVTPAYEQNFMDESSGSEPRGLSDDNTKPKVKPLAQGDISQSGSLTSDSSVGFDIVMRKRSSTQSKLKPASSGAPSPSELGASPSRARLKFPKLEEKSIQPEHMEETPELFESSVSALWRLRVRESRSVVEEPSESSSVASGQWRSWTHFNMEQGRIFAVTQNSKMDYFATAGARRHVEVWSSQSGRIYRLPTSGRIVYTLTSTPDGRVLAAGDDKGKIHIWLLPQVLTNADITSLGSSILYGHVGPLSALATNSTGKLLLSGSLDGTARLWSLEDGACMAILDHGGDPLSGVAFGPKGPVTVSHHGTLRLWDRRGIMIDQIEGFSPLTAVGCRRNSIYLTTSTGEVLRYAKDETMRIGAHAGEASDLSINSQGVLMTVGSDGLVQIHQNGELLTMNIGQDLSAVHALDEMIMIGTKRGTIEVLKLY